MTAVPAVAASVCDFAHTSRRATRAESSAGFTSCTEGTFFASPPQRFPEMAPGIALNVDSFVEVSAKKLKKLKKQEEDAAAEVDEIAARKQAKKEKKKRKESSGDEGEEETPTSDKKPKKDKKRKAAEEDDAEAAGDEENPPKKAMKLSRISDAEYRNECARPATKPPC